MQSFVDELVQQSTEASMIVNGRKTKEMLIGTVARDRPPSVTLSGAPVDHVFQATGRQRRERSQVGPARRRYYLESCVTAAFSQATETRRRRA